MRHLPNDSSADARSHRAIKQGWSAYGIEYSGPLRTLQFEKGQSCECYRYLAVLEGLILRANGRDLKLSGKLRSMTTV